MRKKSKIIAIAISLTFNWSSYAQLGNVGINTENPKTTLEIVGRPNDIAQPDGILVPQMTGDELFAKNSAYTLEHKGTLIFLTKEATEVNRVGKTQNVDSKGFYYYDGHIWIKISDEKKTKEKNHFITGETIWAKTSVRIPYKRAQDGNNQIITPLGVSKTITVPAGSKYMVMLQYSVPAGVMSNPDTYDVRLEDGSMVSLKKHYNAYLGARILKNNQEIREASRKFPIPMAASNDMTPMVTINSNYSEILDNTQGSSDLNIVYSLSGYLEIGDTSSVVVVQETDEEVIIYNMYEDKDNGENFNWGKSSLTYQLYNIQ